MFSEPLNTTGAYCDRDTRLFENEVKFRQVIKGEILLNEGEVAKSFFFILKGAIYQHNRQSDKKYIVIDLHTENDWFLNKKSFVSQTPSDYTIAAFTESDILEINIESIHYLIGQSHAFLQLNKILQPSFPRDYFYDNSLTPLQKYQFIFKNKPQLLQVFPLKMIASFLKITPETLSRVRDKFVRNTDHS